MTLSSGPLRRRLILLLTIALAVNSWPVLDLTQSEVADLSPSQPVLSDESTLAAIETQEVEQADSSVGTGRQNGLASPTIPLLQPPPGWFPSHGGAWLYASRPTPFPNKTGPPSL